MVRQDTFVSRHSVAVIAFQLSENDRGQDGQCAENKKRLVNAMNHLRRVRAETIGNEKRSGQ